MSFHFPAHKVKPGKLGGWMEEPNFNNAYRTRPGVTTASSSAHVVKPLCFKNPKASSPKDETSKLDLEVIPMNAPVNSRGKRVRRTEKISVLRECDLEEIKDDARVRRKSAHLPRLLVVVLVLMFLMCSGSLLMTILLYLGKAGPYCSCADYGKGESPSADAISSPQTVVTKRLLAFQWALNTTRHEVEELKQVWDAVNATKEDLEKNVWVALYKTKENLEHRVWVDVNSTKEDVQQLNETFQNLTTEMKDKLSVIWNNTNFTQKFCSGLMLKVDTISDKMNNISKMPGPTGPPGHNGSQGLNGSQGPAGPPGPKGAGDFSQCQYKSEGSNGGTSGVAAKEDVFVTEPSDKRIVGATCSTDNAKEYRLSSREIKPGKRFYRCDCAGQSKIMNPGGKTMKCFLHYWECPKP